MRSRAALRSCAIRLKAVAMTCVSGSAPAAGAPRIRRRRTLRSAADRVASGRSTRVIAHQINRPEDKASMAINAAVSRRAFQTSDTSLRESVSSRSARIGAALRGSSIRSISGGTPISRTNHLGARSADAKEDCATGSPSSPISAIRICRLPSKAAISRRRSSAGRRRRGEIFQHSSRCLPPDGEGRSNLAGNGLRLPHGHGAAQAQPRDQGESNRRHETSAQR